MSFEDIVHSGGYVDKTRLIEYFVSQEKHMVVIAPRRFGKSLNIEMLRKFFEIQLDSNGQPIFNIATGNSSMKTEKKNSDFSVFNNLAVCHDKNLKYKTVSPFCREHYASHPVIFLDFHDLDVSSEAGFYNSFRKMIHNLYKNYDYLRESAILEPEDLDQFKDYRLSRPPMRDEHVAYGPYVLSRLLATHFNKSCMTFIDNFDAPAFAMMRETDNKFKSSVLHTLNDLVSDLLKGNDHVKYSLFSAVDFIAPRNMENLVYVPVLEDRIMSQFYGFREQEIKDLLWKLNSMDQLDTVKKMSDGRYRIKNGGGKVYRTFDVNRFLKEAKLKEDEEGNEKEEQDNEGQKNIEKK